MKQGAIANWRRRGAPLAVAVLLLCLGALPSAHADGPPPRFEFFASSAKEGSANAPYPPPGSGFEGPCGVAVDSKANFYVADYYHHNIDVFTPQRSFVTQLTKVDPTDGPCALAVDFNGTLYVNNYHRNVTRYVPAEYPLGPGGTYGPGVVIDEADPTGIAVDPATGRLYVNDRTHVSVYEPSGAALLDGEGHPLQIGSFKDAYGLAVSSYGPTAGRLYVAEAQTAVIEAYDPALDTETPVQVLDGHEVPSGAFVSLRDSALAVDRASGRLYVADLLQPQGYERPEAAIYGFQPGGAYSGRLSYNIIDARPPGLAIDNSPNESIGRLYITSGNSEGARLYAYDPDSLSTQPGSCAPGGPCPPSAQALTGTLAAPASEGAGAKPGAPQRPLGPDRHRHRGASASAEIVQKGTLRVKTDGKIAPQRLPRAGAAPIAVSVAGQISTTDESQPPQLKTLRIEINRHGHLDYTGLPTCPYPKIATASSQRALSSCKSALVGKGSFQANIVLSGQQPYPTEGKLLVFNGEKKGKPVLYGQIYSAHPFATSFVIVFAISKVKGGTYGTALSADLPKALGNWGYVTAIKMRLARRYGYGGEPHSFLSSGCPAPKGFSRIAFPLARTSFDFVGAGRLTSTLTRECRARG